MSSFKAPEEVNFSIRPAANDPVSLKREALNYRRVAKKRFQKARINQKTLASRAAENYKPGADERRGRAHNEAAWRTSVRAAEETARATSLALHRVKYDISLTKATGMEIEGMGASLNEEDHNVRQNNDRFRTQGPISPANREQHPYTSRAKGALLPPPHPKSLGEKMKHSPKAKRDAWRAGKVAGTAPAVNLNPRAKNWDKIKAIEPGELPDLD